VATAGHPLARGLVALALVCAGPLGCVHAGWRISCGLFGQPEPIDANCLQGHAVERYLTGVRDAVSAHYELPPQASHAAYVEFRYVLNLDGSVADRCIARSSDPRIAASLVAAFDAAAPFPPIPEYAHCIAGTQIVRHVYTPERRPQAP
jgi:hypothetical protein